MGCYQLLLMLVWSMDMFVNLVKAELELKVTQENRIIARASNYSYRYYFSESHTFDCDSFFFFIQLVKLADLPIRKQQM